MRWLDPDGQLLPTEYFTHFQPAEDIVPPREAAASFLDASSPCEKTQAFRPSRAACQEQQRLKWNQPMLGVAGMDLLCSRVVHELGRQGVWLHCASALLVVVRRTPNCTCGEMAPRFRCFEFSSTCHSCLCADSKRPLSA